MYFETLKARFGQGTLVLGAALALLGAGAAQPASANNPADGSASAGVRTTLNYLQSVQNSGQILSCQQIGNPWYEDDLSPQGSGESEITRINQLTGKNPAMLGLDWINCDAYPDHRDHMITLAKQWAGRGGLIEFTWHEGSPLQYSPDNSTGFYGSLDAGQWDDLLNHPGSPIHNNWDHHMALLAGWLGQLRDAGVTVIWRPLHEGDGNWFWWGNDGGGNGGTYQALWRQEFNVLTNQYGLHNLIWVDSTPNAGFYPGDGYVDVAGGDIYTGNRTDGSYANLDSTVKSFAGSKVSALSETGLLPDINYLHGSMRFAWVNIWAGEFLDSTYYPPSSGGNPCNTPGTIQEFYNDYRTIDLAHVNMSDGINSGSYYTVTNVASGLNLDDTGWSTSPGTQVELWDAWGGAPQLWRFDRQGDGSYALTNQAANLVLDDPGGSNQWGQHLQLWNYLAGTPQCWRATRQPDGAYTLTNVAAGLNLDNPGGTGPHGTLVQLWPANGATAQEWILTQH